MIFISHSSLNNDKAIAVRDWLVEQGWGLAQIYLDLDSLHSGERWRQALNDIGSNCEAVIACLSDDWLRSPECLREFNHAESGGKPIFPVIVETITERIPSFITDLQFANIADPGMKIEGFERLRHGLLAARIGPKYFPWPPPGEPNRPVFRGLAPLEEQDAAIFFGRDAAIVQGLDELRRLRAGAKERTLVILGASGAGKSSFLRAGLIARLKRDEEHFLVLPVIRPERAALSGAFGLEASLVQALDAPIDPIAGPEALVAIFAALRAPVMARLRRIADADHAAHPEKPPTLVIAVDQAEELYNAENTEAARFLELVTGAIALDGDALAIFTIRSDAYPAMQGDKRLDTAPQLLFNLRPLAITAFQEVIEGPARLAHPPIEIEPALTQQLLADLDAADALPLLAFTLERLKSEYGARGKLILADYRDRMGGLKGAIRGAVDAALGANADAATLGLARRAFVPALVQVDEDGVKRRLASLSDFPPDVLPLIDGLVRQRLLVKDRRTVGGAASETVEVAHEAILRQWPALAGWIAEEHAALRARDVLAAAAAEWGANGRQPAWLVHRGGRLADAQRLTERGDFAPTIGADALAYLAACRTQESDDLERSQRQVQRTRRLQAGIGVAMAFAAVILIVGGLGFARLIAGNGQRTSDTLAMLAGKAAAAGDYDGAARYARAGFAGADLPLVGFQPWAAEAQLRNATAQSTALAVLRGHTNTVTAVAFSADGTRIATASDDGTARLWDARTGAPIGAVMRHANLVVAVAFSPDGTRVATASFDQTARLWDGHTGAPVGAVMRHGGFVNAVAFSPDGARLVTASYDNTARLWDAHTGAPIAVMQHAARVIAVAFSPDGTRVATASVDTTARLWNGATGAPIGAPMRHGSGVIDVAFSPDGTRLATSSVDKTARLWDAHTGAPIGAVMQHGDMVVAVAFSPDGLRLATASNDNTARLWDAHTGVAIGAVMQHAADVNAVAFSPDKVRLATASSDGTARVWDARTGAPLAAPLWQAGGAINVLGFSPDGTRLLTAGSADNTARIWNPDLGPPTGVSLGDSAVDLVAFSSDGSRVATVSLGNTVRLWDGHSGAPIGAVMPHAAPLTAIVFSPDGTHLATATYDGAARLWDAHTGAPIGAVMQHGGLVFALAFSPDGTRVATASADKTARLWDAHTGAPIGAVMQHGDAVSTVAFSPDGTRLVTASEDQTARLWDASTGAPIGAAMQGGAAMERAGFSPDGSRVATTSHGKGARIWDGRSGAPIGAPIDPDSLIEAIVFSPDGARLAVAAYDNTAQLWDARTGVAIGAPMRHDGVVNALAFSPDGTRLATASDDDTARLWDARTGAPIGATMRHNGQVLNVVFSRSGRFLATASADMTARLWDVRTGAPMGAPLQQDYMVYALAFSPDGTRLVTAPGNNVADRLWTPQPSLLESRGALLQRACAITLAGGLSRFSPDELANAPQLDPALDADACRPPSLWARLAALLGWGAHPG